MALIKSHIVILTFTLTSILILFFGGKWQRHTVLKSDSCGYYNYLPATFIYHDLRHFAFYSRIDSIYDPADGTRYYAVHHIKERGSYVLKYTYGVALLEMPAFLVAHLFTITFYPEIADGYSWPYQLAIGLNTILFGIIGLWYVKKLLGNFFPDRVIALALCLLGFGTNFFAQVITQPGMSHVYLFAIFAVLLFKVSLFDMNADQKQLLIALPLMALAVVIRPISIIFCVHLVILILTSKSINEIRLGQRPTRPAVLLLSSMLSILLIGVQLIYWKWATGDFLYWTYKYEGFDFGNSQVLKGLFSYKKGWFVYTPAALAGMFSMIYLATSSKHRVYAYLSLFYFAILIFVTFSWWQWYYGGSFGSRVMVESLVVFAVPFAYAINKLMKESNLKRYAMYTLLSLLVALNIFQTGQYARGIIHWDNMNEAYYKEVFLKWNVSDEVKLKLNESSLSR